MRVFQLVLNMLHQQFDFSHGLRLLYVSQKLVNLCPVKGQLADKRDVKSLGCSNVLVKGQFPIAALSIYRNIFRTEKAAPGIFRGGHILFHI